MKNRTFYTWLSILVLVILLGAQIYFGVLNFDKAQTYLKLDQEYGNLLSYQMDTRELAGTDVDNAKSNGPLLSPGIAINDIGTLGLKPGEHEIVNVGMTPCILRIGGEEKTIQPNEKITAYLHQDTVVAISEGYAVIL